jgi:AcrR family transcriptional regulator
MFATRHGVAKCSELEGTQVRNAKADRRSTRTRRLLSAALIELMLEQRYDEITIQDIIDRANIGRSTFYAHYLDKEDLLVSGFTQVFDTLSQEHHEAEKGVPQALPSLAGFFRHVQEHHQLYKSLVRGGGIERLFKKSRQHMRRNIEQQLAELIPAGQTPAVLPLVADYLSGTIMNMLTWWLDNEMPYTPDQMDALFQQLVRPGVQTTLQVAVV